MASVFFFGLFVVLFFVSFILEHRCERAHAFLYFITFDLRLWSAARSGSTKSGTRRNVNPDPRRLQGCTPRIGYIWFDLHRSNTFGSKRKKKKQVKNTGLRDLGAVRS
uniref:Putative secreted protein n=1 Tax=Ixodes ricinus TaxID=34613 RepID=A0A6B0U9W8_IXORI